jgi:hypothetical protein
MQIFVIYKKNPQKIFRLAYGFCYCDSHLSTRQRTLGEGQNVGEGYPLENVKERDSQGCSLAVFWRGTLYL